mmetsp:Transcript_4950/g.12086  ORF Transcript_4950/g.12086 Transcript_4950/m.12086 type:complete len:172 (-) Transcript_4950:335-850(-)
MMSRRCPKPRIESEAVDIGCGGPEALLAWCSAQVIAEEAAPGVSNAKLRWLERNASPERKPRSRAARKLSKIASPEEQRLARWDPTGGVEGLSTAGSSAARSNSTSGKRSGMPRAWQRTPGAGGRSECGMSESTFTARSRPTTASFRGKGSTASVRGVESERLAALFGDGG